MSTLTFDGSRRAKTILMGHGSGGQLMRSLIDQIVLPRLMPGAGVLNDAAVWDQAAGRLALTTDTFVVDPPFFPGGDIGSLAVHGTVNDLAVSGARPLYMSVGLILEEGFAMAGLERILDSMREAADAAGVGIVAGDTKVVGRGQCDGIFINTTGVGVVEFDSRISADRARAGDRILINAPIAIHGVAVMAAREELRFAREILSDSASLYPLTRAMLGTAPEIACLRDATRGGIASVLNEIAESSNVGIRIDESRLPIADEVRGACELLGMDPLYVANEGVLVAVVPSGRADAILAAMRSVSTGRLAADIGEVIDDHPGRVTMRTGVGGFRVVDTLVGELLPRIC